jgi:hypothetical protein
VHRWLALVVTLAVFPCTSIAGTTANDLCAPNADPCVVNTAINVDNASVINLGARRLEVRASGQLLSRGSSSSPGGSFTIMAGSISIAGRIDVSGTPGGRLTLESSGDVSISGTILSEFLSGGADGGFVTMNGTMVTISGSISARGSSSNAIGGTITVRGQTGVTLSGTLNASGSDGGDIVLIAGSMTSPANLSVNASGQARADSTTGGGIGGSVTLVAFGDGQSSGHVTMDGVASVSAPGGTFDTGGGLGGVIDIQAAGDVRGTNTAGSLICTGGGPDGEGGEISVTALGSYNLAASIDCSIQAIESAGGIVSIDVVGGIMFTAPLNASGGGFDGGDVSIESANGPITIASGATVNVSATSGGFGGGIEIVSGTSVQDGAPLLMAGALTATGGAAVEGFAGDGGNIDLSASDQLRVTGSINAEGGSGSGGGGTVFLTAANGEILLENQIVVRGRGQLGLGGVVQILGAESDVTVRGTVQTDAGTVNDQGGQITISGCTIAVEATGVLSSLGMNGQNLIILHDDAVVLGRMQAGGRNEFRFGGPQPFITGVVQPAPVLIRDTSILPCGVPTFTPTPTRTPTTGGPTRTLTPTRTPGGACVGDCNRDGAVTVDELVLGVNIALGNAEIEQCRAFDANGDGLITVDELIQGVNNALDGCPA